MGPFDRPPLPSPVDAALRNLQDVAQAHGLKLSDALTCITPNQALLWAASDEVQRLRRLLDRLAPGWNDDI